MRVETLTHQAGDAPDLMMDDGVEAVYHGIPLTERGPGVHIMTGPIRVAEAEPGDTLEVRLLAMEPRLPYGTNIAAWWGYLYDDFGKERITIYHIDRAAGLARAAFAFDYTTTPRYDQPGIVVPHRWRPHRQPGACIGGEQDPSDAEVGLWAGLAVKP